MSVCTILESVHTTYECSCDASRWLHRGGSLRTNMRPLENGSLLISPVLATSEGWYACELQATSAGEHLSRLERLEHRVRVLGVSVPDAPKVDALRVPAAGSASGSGSGALQLEWRSASTHGSPLTGFALSCTAERAASAYPYAALHTSLLDEMRKWNASRSELEGCTHNVPLDARARSHRFRALRCGASYSFDVSALNAHGASTPGSAYLHGSCMRTHIHSSLTIFSSLLSEFIRIAPSLRCLL